MPIPTNNFNPLNGISAPVQDVNLHNFHLTNNNVLSDINTRITRITQTYRRHLDELLDIRGEILNLMHSNIMQTRALASANGHLSPVSPIERPPTPPVRNYRRQENQYNLPRVIIPHGTINNVPIRNEEN